MTNAMAAFGIAVGGTSLIFYALMTRLQNRRRIRRSSGDGSSASDSATYATGDGWTMAGWFGGSHSGPHGFGNSMDGLGNPIEFGGGSDSAEATGEAVATEAAEAINACQPWNKPDRILI